MFDGRAPQLEPMWASTSCMSHLNIEKLRAAKLETDPFEHAIVPAFLSRETVRSINATYPPIAKGGSYLIETLDTGMTVKAVIDELDAPEFEAAISEKFGVNLAGKPKTGSRRGYTRD